MPYLSTLLRHYIIIFVLILLCQYDFANSSERAAERGLLKPDGNIDDGPFLRSLTIDERAILKRMFDSIEEE